MTATPQAAELRDRLRQSLAEAFLAETGSTWLFDKGAEMVDVLLADPEIAAALKIKAAVDAEKPIDPPHTSSIAGRAHDKLLTKFRVAGVL